MDFGPDIRVSGLESQQEVLSAYEDGLDYIEEQNEGFEASMREIPDIVDMYHLFENNYISAFNKLSVLENELSRGDEMSEQLHDRCREVVKEIDRLKDEALHKSDFDFEELDIAMQRYRVKLSDPTYFH